MEVHVFSVAKYTGTLVESDEMKPAWYHVSDIPFKEMWLDDELWFPTFLEGKIFRGQFVFQAHDELVSSAVTEVEESALDAILRADWKRTE